MLALKIVFSILFLLVSSNLSAYCEPYKLAIPLGLTEPAIPENNPMTVEKIALGKKLYFDKRLSADDTVACSNCHDPKLGFADALPTSAGIRGQFGPRNAPTVLNSAFYDLQFWDGRVPSLEDQAKGPIINPVEMGMASHDDLVKKLKGIPEYVKDFQAVFGAEITIDRIVQAIAAFERTLISGNSPFDRFFYNSESDAISEPAKKGLLVFRGKGRCLNCHDFNPIYALFTDNKFHNIGVGMDKAEPDPGRFKVTGNSADQGAFKTSTLRNIALTAPYMHDGSQKTLEEVVEFYNQGGHKNPYLDGGIVPLNLTDQEKKDLVEFLKSLTGEMPKL